MVTIAIATKNRPKEIENCIDSLLANSYRQFEIIVADQSDNIDTRKKVSSYKSKKIRYIHLKRPGKSRALNTAIRLAKGDILAFTDDDCIASRNWIGEIVKSYEKHPSVAGVFGNTYPFRPKDHPNEICPATFIGKRVAMCKNPTTLHYRNLGQGNNMSIRKSIIESVGYFQEWLGPGGPGAGGEDGDIIFRILSCNLVLMTNPKGIVYHNKWLTAEREKVLQCSYSYQFMAFSGYYIFTNYGCNAGKLMRLRFHERITPALSISRLFSRGVIKNIYLLSFEVLSMVGGLFVGGGMSIWNFIHGIKLVSS